MRHLIMRNTITPAYMEIQTRPRKSVLLRLVLLLTLSLALPAFAAHHMPGKGVKVQPARATWNTGYFQEALVRAGLKELANAELIAALLPPRPALNAPAEAPLMPP